jgi:hypothetical protein
MLDVRGNEYADGTQEKGAMVATSRRAWKLTKRIPPSALATLWSFWQDHIADAFYFYNLKETSPLFTWDPTGAAVAGRYTVRFDGDWDEQIFIPRAEVGLQLVEIA